MNDDSSGPKEAAPDPEIPDELRSKISRPKRPAGFTPKSEEAESYNAKPEVALARPQRDLTAFWDKLGQVLAGGKFYSTVTEERERKRRIPGSKNFELVREKVDIKVEVALTVGQDGLPYPGEAVTADESRRLSAMQYPGAPKMDPMIGDLTPDFVEWLYLHHPYDAAVRYFARRTHIQSAALARAT